jgi:type VI secretion system secreted protein VgrG
MAKETFLAVWTEAGADLSPRRFAVDEALSEPFVVELCVRSASHDIDPETILNRPASFRMHSGIEKGHSPERVWTGVCNAFELVRTEHRPGTVGESTYRMTIVPRLWLLGLTSDARIFRHASIPDIVREVLAEWEIEPETKLTRGDEHYPPLEYVAQYGESDLAFVSRLLEAAGISYFFVHGLDAPTKLVLCDEPQRPGGEVPMYAWEREPQAAARKEYVTAVRLGRALRPGRCVLRDFDFRFAPTAVVQDAAFEAAEPDGDAREAELEQYRWAPGDFRVKGEGGDPVADEKGQWAFRHLPDEGQRRAERELAALGAERRFVRFASNSVGLAPGRVFAILGHPHPGLADDKELLVVAYRLHGQESSDWRCDGCAVMASDAYAPPLVTPKPRIAGVQSAFVAGDGEIDCDEHGRVRAQLHWYRRGTKPERERSCWMRVSQLWAGKGYGLTAVPRVGQEVMVGYLDGDCDLPVVAGRLYDLTRPNAYKLPDHVLKTVLKSKTSPEQADPPNAYNELRFDDTADDELVYVQAQRDHQMLVKNHATERAGQSRVTVVGGSRAAVVATEDAVLVGEKYSVQVIETPDKGKEKIEDKKELKLLDQKAPALKPRPTKLEMLEGKILVTSGGASVLLEGADVVFNANGGQLTLKAGGDITIFGGPDIKINS